jgi:hypothetical protein
MPPDAAGIRHASLSAEGQRRHHTESAGRSTIMVQIGAVIAQRVGGTDCFDA